MTANADMRQPPTEARCFRPRRSYLLIGVGTAVLFVLMGITSTVVAYWNLDGSFARPRLAALAFGTLWSGLTLLAVWIILAYFRERLYLASDRIIRRGIFRSRTLVSQNVIHINWRRWPVGGSLVVRTLSEKIHIDLGDFTSDERAEVVRFFRKTFAQEIQVNWSHLKYAPRVSHPKSCGPWD